MFMITRYIYAYRERDTGRPVYVGSAFDVKKRDKGHCTENKIPFDREIVRRGRDAFTLETVDSVTAENEAAVMTLSVSLENGWMDILSTFRTEHGFNFFHAVIGYSSQEHFLAARAAIKATWSNPEVKAKAASSAVQAGARPEVIARRSHAQRIACNTSEARARLSAKAKAQYTTTASRVQQSAIAKKRYENLGVRAQHSAACSTPESRFRRTTALKKYYANPNAIVRKSAEQKNRWNATRYYGA
jgi:hypothetical protein